MTSPEQLIKAAISTLISEGRSLEDAQVAALMTVSKIAAASGPKNLQRLINENRIALISDRTDPTFCISPAPSENDTFLPVPKILIAAARGWLQGQGMEEDRIAAELWDILYPEVKS
jgi:hypothetical protein